MNNIDFQHAGPRLAPFEKIRSVAGKLADSALAAYHESQYQNQVRLGAEERELPLLYRKPTPEMLERARRVLAEPDEKKLPQHAKAYAERVIKLYDGPDRADVKLQALRVSGLGIAAIPCEVFTETGLELQGQEPVPQHLHHGVGQRPLRISADTRAARTRRI